MARYDYRVRRRIFRQTDINRHQNFDELQKRYTHRKRTTLLRNILILAGLILLVLALIMTAHADQKHEEYVPTRDYPEIVIDVVEEIS